MTVSRSLLPAVAMLGGCYGGYALARQGSVGGPAIGGMLGRAELGAHYESGIQRAALGVEAGFAMAATKEDRPLFETMAIAGRYARQLGASPAWRGFAAGSIGIGNCQWKSCTPERSATVTSHTTATLSIGAEYALHREPDGMLAVWTDLGVIYSHADDAMRGASDFVGLALGVRLDLDMIAIVQTRRP